MGLQLDQKKMVIFKGCSLFTCAQTCFFFIPFFSYFFFLILFINGSDFSNFLVLSFTGLALQQVYKQ